MNRLPPLPPDIESLLEPHRAVRPLAPPVQARALARAASASTAAPERSAPRAAAKVYWAFAASIGAAIGVGAAAYAIGAWLGQPKLPAASRMEATVVASPSEPSLPLLSAPARSPETGPTMERAPETASPIAPVPMKTARSAIRAESPRSPSSELLLLKLARDAVTIGDFESALTVIAEHAHRFPKGILVEEREALRVKSLLGLGRHEDARRAAAEFHSRFPRSALLSTFDHVAESRP